MNVKKVLVLTEDEVNTIVNCGKLCREINNGLKDKSIDELAPETQGLTNALFKILQEVTFITASTIKEEVKQ